MVIWTDQVGSQGRVFGCVSERLIGLGQPDAAERISEVLGEVLAIRRKQSRPTLSLSGKGCQQVQPHRVTLPEIHDHLIQAEDR